jgi:hypothetical protein
MIGQVRAKYRHIIQARRDRQLSPERLQAGDTFIVEFPKSGVTWLTMLVANAFAIKLGLKETVTFASVRRFIPDLHASRSVAPRVSPSGLGFYKSHATFNRNYATTIYMVRHPLAVLRSYHKYRAVLDPLTTPDLRTFLSDPNMGLAAWKRHVQSWLMTPRDTAQRQLHLVRYEDLLADAGAVLAGLDANLGWGLTDATVAKAVERSTRDEMLLQEERYRRNNPAHIMNFVGTGGGTPDPAIAKKVASKCRPELKQLGYEVDAT